MARPKWTPQTDEQRDAVTAAERAAERLENAEKGLWAAIAAARKLSVPMSHLAQIVGKGRATLYRKALRTKAQTDEVETSE